MTSDLAADTYHHRAVTAINTRLANLSEEEVKAMTAKARAGKYARYIERLKDIVDPDQTMSDAERTRRANNLAEARRAKAELDRLRRERNQAKVRAAEEAFQAEMAS